MEPIPLLFPLREKHTLVDSPRADLTDPICACDLCPLRGLAAVFELLGGQGGSLGPELWSLALGGVVLPCLQATLADYAPAMPATAEPVGHPPPSLPQLLLLAPLVAIKDVLGSPLGSRDAVCAILNGLPFVIYITLNGGLTNDMINKNPKVRAVKTLCLQAAQSVQCRHKLSFPVTMHKPSYRPLPRYLTLTVPHNISYWAISHVTSIHFFLGMCVGCRNASGHHSLSISRPVFILSGLRVALAGDRAWAGNCGAACAAKHRRSHRSAARATQPLRPLRRSRHVPTFLCVHGSVHCNCVNAGGGGGTILSTSTATSWYLYLYFQYWGIRNSTCP